MVQNVYTDCFIPEIGCRLYLDASGEVAAPLGKYSDGTNCYSVDSGGYVTAVNMCGELQFQFTSTDISDFIWAMDITGSNFAVTLPLLPPTAGPNDRPDYTYDFYVNWGDGTISGPITQYDSILAQHTYTSPGIYTASISGRMETWNTSRNPGFSYGTKHVMKDVIQWGNTGLTTISVGESRNLDSICGGQPSQYTWYDVQSFARDCRFWGDLTIRPNSKPIREDTFKYASNVGTFIDAFWQLPAQSFIPENLFNRCFAGVRFTGAFGSGFGNSSGATFSLPSGSGFISSGSYFGITDLRFMFLNDINITNLYSSSFDNVINLYDRFSDFGGTTIQGGGLRVDEFIKVTVSGSAVPITGDAPEFWIHPIGTPAPTGTEAFRNRVGLSNFASIPGSFK